MNMKLNAPSELASVNGSPFVVFDCDGKGNRFAVHRDRVTMVHEEREGTLLKLDMGSGNYETSKKLPIAFDEVMRILANVRMSDGL